MIDVMETEVKVVKKANGVFFVRVKAGDYTGVVAFSYPEKDEIISFKSEEDANEAAADAVKLLGEYAAMVVAKGPRWGMRGQDRITSIWVDGDIPGRSILLVKPKLDAPLTFSSQKAAEASAVDFIEALIPSGTINWSELKIKAPERIR